MDRVHHLVVESFLYSRVEKYGTDRFWESGSKENLILRISAKLLNFFISSFFLFRGDKAGAAG